MNNKLEELDMRKWMAKCQADNKFNSPYGPSYHNNKDYEMAIAAINENYNKAVSLINPSTKG